MLSTVIIPTHSFQIMVTLMFQHLFYFSSLSQIWSSVKGRRIGKADWEKEAGVGRGRQAMDWVEGTGIYNEKPGKVV